jgi:hypothetical protein
MKLQTIIAALTLSVCAASAQNVVPPPTIHISGSAEVKVVPDEIFLNVGVETRDPQLDKAVAQHNEQMTRALSFLRSSGIAPKDLQTDYIGVDPEFDSNVSRVKPAVYVVRKSIEIRLDSTADLEPTLTGLLTNGESCAQRGFSNHAVAQTSRSGPGHGDSRGAGKGDCACHRAWRQMRQAGQYHGERLGRRMDGIARSMATRRRLFQHVQHVAEFGAAVGRPRGR